MSFHVHHVQAAINWYLPMTMSRLISTHSATCWRSNTEIMAIYFSCNCRVGHLILTALSYWASDPQNAVVQTSFHSPKVYPSPPPSTLPFHRQLSELFQLFSRRQLIHYGKTFPHFGCDQF